MVTSSRNTTSPGLSSLAGWRGAGGDGLVVRSVEIVLMVLVLSVLARFVLGGLLLLGVGFVVGGERWVTFQPGVLLCWGGGASVLGGALQRGDALRANSG